MNEIIKTFFLGIIGLGLFSLPIIFLVRVWRFFDKKSNDETAKINEEMKKREEGREYVKNLPRLQEMFDAIAQEMAYYDQKRYDPQRAVRVMEALEREIRSMNPSWLEFTQEEIQIAREAIKDFRL